jgi:hypothetical protein
MLPSKEIIRAFWTGPDACHPTPPLAVGFGELPGLHQKQNRQRAGLFDVSMLAWI